MRFILWTHLFSRNLGSLRLQGNPYNELATSKEYATSPLKVNFALLNKESPDTTLFLEKFTLFQCVASINASILCANVFATRFASKCYHRGKLNLRSVIVDINILDTTSFNLFLKKCGSASSCDNIKEVLLGCRKLINRVYHNFGNTISMQNCTCLRAVFVMSF